MNVVLVAANIEVEDPSILPGVTQGGWRLQECSGYIKVLVGDKHIATYWGEEEERRHPSWKEAQANAKLSIASKELAEAVIGWLEAFPGGCVAPAARCMINALEKAGVEVEKFRR